MKKPHLRGTTSIISDQPRLPSRTETWMWRVTRRKQTTRTGKLGSVKGGTELRFLCGKQILTVTDGTMQAARRVFLLGFLVRARIF